MKIRERIIALMQQADYAPLDKSGISAELGLGKKERRTLDYEVRLLLANGDIVRIKGDRFAIPKDVDLVTGTIKFRQKGSAILIPDATKSDPNPKPVQINAEDTSVAMHDDKVVVRIADAPPNQPLWKNRNKKPGPPLEGPFGRVIRIQKRARDTVVGTLCKTRFFHYVAPDDPRIIHDIYVPPPEESGLNPVPVVGDKVVAKLHEWEQRHVNPEGELIANLGKTHEPQAELMAVLHKYNLETEFPPEVMKEAEAVPDKVTKNQLKGRRDLRKAFTFTIDPDDAKDFDDAISLEYPDSKHTRVGIHIADVAAYVRGGTKLDKEAFERGNSTYLVGIVIPMLPRSLSNGICSLVEDEDRLTKSVFVTFDKKGEIVDVDYANTVIRSNKRLTYKQAYALLKNDDLQVARDLQLPPAHQTGSTGRALNTLSNEELGKLQKSIRELWSFASKLRAARFKKGSLNLDMEETKIFVDEKGYADRLEKIHNDESHQLIEEYMLLANECVAREMKRNRLPCIYRVHEDPDEERLNDLREYMATWGIETADLNNRKDLVKLLETLSAHPQSRLLRTQVLRSLKKACYKSTPDGHYGLCKNDYLHFTSPIRRYSDLVTHRVFNHFLNKVRGEPALAEPGPRYNASKAASIAEHLSHTEVNSVEAERESVKVKLLEFFERELDKKPQTAFDAIITEVRNHGMFIELKESSAFGMVHISALRDDLYRLNASGTALIGRRKKNAYSLGQTIQVEVHKVDRFKRQVDFRLCAQQRKDNPKPTIMPSDAAAPASTPPSPKGRGNASRNGRRESSEETKPGPKKFFRKQKKSKKPQRSASSAKPKKSATKSKPSKKAPARKRNK
ncbi:RNB domain-containing ribonuclease [Pelagicoccus enzymogenes]|uniref:ribonuclease R family protein n=1 Tax=Pelagicoccus enzymogenes TaxID=2773457 RepID=UPI00280D8068|nr:RNB domain-containing ribonuclease [Pelagicoccus enzymogenes]MDQ8201134.1 RNB domain-containing ribonuclease [Pelagicoccus enzymogenes]